MTETAAARPQYLCPGRARLTTTYRFRALAGQLVEDPGQAYGRTIEKVLEWLSEKVPHLLPLPDWHLPSFRKEEQGQVLEVVSLPHRSIWAARLTHPDVGLGGQYKPVAGRSWTTDVSVVSVGGQVRFGIEVFASTLNPEAPQPAFIRPGVIKTLAKDVGLVQVRLLDGKPWTIESAEDLDDLEILLGDKDRDLAVLVVSQPDPRHWDGPGEPPESLLDCETLARKTLGYAHVVRLPFNLSFEWTKRVGKAWSVFDGAVRTYMPGLDFERDSLSAHPLAFKDRILAFSAENAQGPEAFQDFLMKKMWVTMPRVPFPWQPLVFVPDARVVESEERARERLGGEACRDCQEQYDKQAEALKDKIRSAEEEVEKWLQAADDYSKELDYEKHRSIVLQCAVESLRAQLEEKTGKSLDDDVSIPETYEGMQEWVEEHLAGRLVFLPRAARAVKDAVYEDVPLVYKGLLLLANEYRNMRLRVEEAGKEKFEARCGELGLRFGGSMTEVAAGQYESEYYVDYPVGSGLKHKLEFHLRKGSTKDDRLCLGIYFFWDDQARLVVVGSLPAHLRTRAT
jgi:hypothetical protein